MMPDKMPAGATNAMAEGLWSAWILPWQLSFLVADAWWQATTPRHHGGAGYNGHAQLDVPEILDDRTPSGLFA